MEKQKVRWGESTNYIFEKFSVEELLYMLPGRIHHNGSAYELLIGKRDNEGSNGYYRVGYVWRYGKKTKNLFGREEDTLHKTLYYLVSSMCHYEEEGYNYLKNLPIEMIFTD